MEHSERIGISKSASIFISEAILRPIPDVVGEIMHECFGIGV
jgi:hypothetical protein